ncbi:MAG: hypothetical protein H6797_02015 [Candidatus Nomurabacteria bacterium]|nr:MAG: hypothetical protein H6797_02015 [Candidatus Nomurabacteria bacterium]
MESHFEWQQATDAITEFDDVLDDGFDLVEDRKVRHLIEDALKKGEHYKAARIAKDMREALMEHTIRKRIFSVAEAAGGKIGIERLMNSVCETEGESAMNATLCLVYIMQAEGKMSIYAAETSDEIIVELLRRRRR